jgi:hypothetical protein
MSVDFVDSFARRAQCYLRACGLGEAAIDAVLADCLQDQPDWGVIFAAGLARLAERPLGGAAVSLPPSLNRGHVGYAPIAGRR